MTPLLRPVTKTKCSTPASRASSTTYWISGRSTMVSISFGIALVAGRTRVPRPATGKTALRIFMGERLLAGKRTGRPFVTGFSEIEKPTKNRFVKLMETVTRPVESRMSGGQGMEIDDGTDRQSARRNGGNGAGRAGAGGNRFGADFGRRRALAPAERHRVDPDRGP